MKKLLLAVVTVMIVVVPLTFANAQQTAATFSMTEDEINESFWVTNPINRRLSDVYVDLQDGQIDISALYALRRQPALALDAIYTPSIVNGIVEWTLVSLTIDGQPATEQQIQWVNGALRTQLRRTVRDYMADHGYIRYTITDITLTEDSVSVSYTVP